MGPTQPFPGCLRGVAHCPRGPADMGTRGEASRAAGPSAHSAPPLPPTASRPCPAPQNRRTAQNLAGAGTLHESVSSLSSLTAQMPMTEQGNLTPLLPTRGGDRARCSVLKISWGQVISPRDRMDQNNRLLGRGLEACTTPTCSKHGGRGAPWGCEPGPACPMASSCPDHRDRPRGFWRQEHQNQAEGSAAAEVAPFAATCGSTSWR